MTAPEPKPAAEPLPCPICGGDHDELDHEWEERERMADEMAGSACGPRCGYCGRCS